VSQASARFWSVMTMPNATTSHPHWEAPLVRTRRYFCCGTAQRAWFSCGCLKLPRDGKESWPYCLDHPLPPLPPASEAPPCLVYSFGIANQWEFDDTMAARGCEVHSFDPTGSTMGVHTRHSHPSGRVHFHPWGLSNDASRKCAGAAHPAALSTATTDTKALLASSGAKGTFDAIATRRYSGGTYGALTGPLLPLERIVRKLRHSGRRITLLKIDCEGCARSERSDPRLVVRAHAPCGGVYPRRSC
jgi:hypothetical protein